MPIQKVLISDDIDPVCVEVLKQNGIQVTHKTKLEKEELKSLISDQDALIVRSATKVTAEILEAGKNLKLVGRAGTGVDNIDIGHATSQGVMVMNTPSGNSMSAAELTCGMLLSLARRIPQAAMSMREGKWERKAFMGNELQGKTLAIVGLGRIGRLVAERMQSFGMKTIGFDPLVSAEQSAEFGVEWTELDGIWPLADYVTLHVPLIPQTRNMINKEVFAKCKKGIRIVNCARGGIIEENDALEALNANICGGLALDVYEEEPPKGDTLKLIQHPQVISTPHIGASTKEAQLRVAEEISQQIVDFNKTGSLTGILNAPALAASLNPVTKGKVQAASDLGTTLAALVGSPSTTITLRIPQDDQKLSRSLKTAVLAGFVRGVSPNSPVNFINADKLAQNTGVECSVEVGSEAGLMVAEASGKSVGGGESDGGTRLVSINGQSLSLSPICTGVLAITPSSGLLSGGSLKGCQAVYFTNGDISVGSFATRADVEASGLTAGNVSVAQF